MRITKISILNLNSIRSPGGGPQIIDLENPKLSRSGIFAIVGDTGSGKTTILDAISLALYGKTGRNHQDEIMNRESGSCFAEVEFESKGIYYRAKYARHRSKNKSDGKLQTARYEISRLPENDLIAGPRKKDVLNKIEEITGLGYEQFRRSVILEQGEFARFLKSNEGERGDLLERITGTESYSTISKAAFEKSAIEKRHLMDQEILLKGLEILDEEAEQELKHIKNEKLKLLGDAAILEKQFLSQLSWYEEWEKYKKEEEQAKHELTTINQKYISYKFQFDQILHHEKALAFKPMIDEIYYHKGEIVKRREEKEKLDQQIDKLAKDFKLQELEFKKLHEEFVQIQQKSAEFEVIWSSVKKLDTELFNLNKSSTKSAKEIEKLENELNNIAGEKHELQKKTEQNKKEINQVITWLEKNNIDAEIGMDINAIEMLFFQIKQKEDQIQEYLNSQINKKEKSGILKVKKEKQHKNQLELQTSVEEMRIEFAKIAQSDTDKSRATVLDQLFDQHQKLQASLSEVAILEQKWQSYEGLKKRALDLDERSKDIRLKLEDTKKKLPQLEKSREKAEDYFRDKQKIFDLQQKVKNYEEERKRLVPGERCPLCLSKTHDLEYHWEIDQAKEARDEASKNLRKLETTILEFTTQIETLIKQKNELILDRDSIQKEIQQFSKWHQNVKQKSLPQPISTQNIAYHRNKIEAQLKGLNKRMSALRKLDDTLNLKEKELNRLNQAIALISQELYQLNSEAKELLDRMEKIHPNIDRDKKDLDLILAKYKVEFNRPELISHLHDRMDAFDGFLARKEAAVNEDQMFQQAIKYIVEKEDVTLNRIHLEKQEYQELQHTISRIRTERNALFGIKDPDKEKMDFQRLLDQKQLHSKEQLNHIQDLQVQIVEKQVTSVNLGKEINNYSKRITELESNVKVKLKESEFGSLEELHSVFLPDDVFNELKLIKSELEDSMVGKNALLKNIAEQMKGLQKRAKPTLEKVFLQTELAGIRQQQEILNQDIGAILAKIQNNETLKKRARHQLDEIKGQKKEWMRWEQLNELIGQKDGKKFKKFAQSITLNQLVHLANKYLIQLNPRYTIKKDTRKDLELNIIDLYQANQQRPMHTLSGGESFLVSLSLALGLSDLAGRNTQIKSLFIDEGFGTLDERTLDVAIQTLENLRNMGKTIGIISHVPALKERISAQIQVIKKGGGRSEINIVA